MYLPPNPSIERTAAHVKRQAGKSTCVHHCLGVSHCCSHLPFSVFPSRDRGPAIPRSARFATPQSTAWAATAIAGGSEGFNEPSDTEGPPNVLSTSGG